MKINIIGSSANMCGLTLNNLRHPEVLNFLRTKGMTVSFQNSESAVISSSKPICIDSAFQKKIKELELLPANETEYSWDILNGFITVLGAAAIAVTIALLCGAAVTDVVAIGFITVVAALATYGLFCCYNQNDCNDINQNNLALEI